MSMAMYNDLDTVPAITCKGDFTAKPPDGSQYVADVRPELMKWSERPKSVKFAQYFLRTTQTSRHDEIRGAGNLGGSVPVYFEIAGSVSKQSF